MTQQLNRSARGEGETAGRKLTPRVLPVLRWLRDRSRDSPAPRRMPSGIVMRDNDGNIIRIISGQDGR